MRELVEFMVKSLVNEPDQVTINIVREDEHVAAYEVHTAPEDFGKVVGRQGRVAKAMRSVLRAAGAKQGKHTSLDIV